MPVSELPEFGVPGGMRRFVLAAAAVALPVLAAVALVNAVADPFGYRGRPLQSGLNDVRSEVFYRAARPTQLSWLRTQAGAQNRHAELLVGTSRVVRGFDACAHPQRGTMALPMLTQYEMTQLVRDVLPPPPFEQTVWIELAQGANAATSEAHGSRNPNRDDLFSWNAVVTSLDNWATSRSVGKVDGVAGCYVPPQPAVEPLRDSIGRMHELENDPRSLGLYRDLLARLAPSCAPSRRMVLALLPVYVAPQSWQEAQAILGRYDATVQAETARANQRWPACRFEYRDLALTYLQRGSDAIEADVKAGHWVDGVHFTPALGESLLAGANAR